MPPENPTQPCHMLFTYPTLGLPENVSFVP